MAIKARAQKTLTKIFDGSGVFSIIATNENTSIPISNQGLPLNYSSTPTDVYVYSGTSLLTPVTSNPEAGQFTLTASGENITAGLVTINDNHASVANASNMTTGKSNYSITLTASGKDFLGNPFSAQKKQVITPLKRGDDATSYWENVSSSVITKDVKGNMTPESTTVSAVYQSGMADPDSYDGIFKVYLKSGINFSKTPDYTSSEPEQLHKITPKSDTNDIRVELYDATGANLLDIQTVPVISQANGVISTKIVYTVTSSQVQPNDSANWADTVPTVGKGQYLWTKTTFYYTDGSNAVAYSLGSNGKDGASAALLTLVADSQIVTFDSDGATPLPASQTITLTAVLQNLTGTATFVATPYLGTAAGKPVTLGGTGNVRTLTASQLGSQYDSISVKATLGELSDTTTIHKLTKGKPGEPGPRGDDGTNSYSGWLTNESIALQADSNGNVPSFTSATGSFVVYNGFNQVTGLTVTQANAHGITVSLSGMYYSVTGMSADNGYVDLSVTTNGITIIKRLTVAKSKAGATGANGTSVVNSTTPPKNPTEGQWWNDLSVIPNILKVYQRGSWIPYRIDAINLVAGSIKTDNLAADVLRASNVKYTNSNGTTTNLQTFDFDGIKTLLTDTNGNTYSNIESAVGSTSVVRKLGDSFNNLSIGGRNLYLNSKGLADGYGGNGPVKATVEPFDSNTNMWHIVAAQGSGTYNGIYLASYANGKIPNNSDWSYSADIKGTGKIVTFGIEDSTRNPIKGTIGSEWSRISQTGHVNETNTKTIIMYFDNTDRPLDVYIKLPKLETGTIATDWSPAPEDVEAKVDNISVGGRNLLLGTEQFAGDMNRWQWYGTWDADPYNGHKAVQTNAAWGGPKYIINDLFNRKVVEPNTDYTLSVKIKNTSNSPMDIYFFAPSIGISDRHIIKLPPNSDWTTISTTFQFSDINPDIEHGSMRFEPSHAPGASLGTVIQTEMKFERGNIATDWSPAPEDVDKQISKLQNATFWQPYSSLNFNDYTQQGSFFFNTIAAKTNGPVSGNNSWLYLTVEQGTADNSRIKQTAWYDGVDGIKITYARTLNSGIWSPWYANDNDSVTTISQTSDAIRANLGSTNLFPNSEFEKDYGYRQKNGNTTLSLGTKDDVGGRFNGSVHVTSTSNEYQGYWTRDIPVYGGQKYSMSVLVHYLNGGLSNGNTILDIWFVDKDWNRITQGDGGNNARWAGQADNPYWVKLYAEGVTAPINAAYVQVSLLVNEAGAGQIATFTQPMVTATEKLQPYAVNNDITIQLELLKDNYTLGIDSNGNLLSGITGDTKQVTLRGNAITLDGNTKVNGDFYAKGGNFKNINIANVSGHNPSLIKSNFDSAYGNVSITPTNITLQSYNGPSLMTELAIGSMGISIKMPGVPSFLESTLINANGMSFQHNGGSYAAVGVMDAGFTLEHNNLGGAPMSIKIGDGVHNMANEMAFAISSAQDNGTSPQLIWAGYKVGKISTKFRTWDNPAGFIIADNIKFSTWDNTASRVEFDDTVNFYNYAPIQVYGQRFSDGTTRKLHLSGKETSFRSKWFGFLNDRDQAGFGTDNTDDVMFFMKGKVYSLYEMLDRLHMR